MKTATIIPERLALLPSMRLAAGAHERFEDGACALEAIAWLTGEKHSDHPSCVCPVIGAMVRRLNDSWSGEVRNKWLLPLLPRLVGTASTPEVARRRAYLAVDQVLRVILLPLLDRGGRPETSTALRALEPIGDSRTAIAAREVCLKWRAAAYAAYADHAAYAADAAYFADLADDAAYFADLADLAAYASAADAAAYASASAASAAAVADAGAYDAASAAYAYAAATAALEDLLAERAAASSASAADAAAGAYAMREMIILINRMVEVTTIETQGAQL